MRVLQERLIEGEVWGMRRGLGVVRGQFYRQPEVVSRTVPQTTELFRREPSRLQISDLNTGYIFRKRRKHE